jgi:hypothetical protein
VWSVFVYVVSISHTYTYTYTHTHTHTHTQQNNGTFGVKESYKYFVDRVANIALALGKNPIQWGECCVCVCVYVCVCVCMV